MQADIFGLCSNSNWNAAKRINKEFSLIMEELRIRGYVYNIYSDRVEKEITHSTTDYRFYSRL